MKNAAFIKKWWDLCNSYHFNNFQFKEQDILNLMCEFGDWKVKYLDDGDSFNSGIKGETQQFKIRLKNLS